MKTASLAMLTLAASLTARADFSYSTTTKMSAGMMSGAMGGMNDRATQHFFKGNKMKMDLGDSAIVLDFDAQTFTHIEQQTEDLYRHELQRPGLDGERGAEKVGCGNQRRCQGNRAE